MGGVLLFSLALVIAGGPAEADTIDFTYQGIAGTNYADVFGSGSFTTGTAYANGYLPITSISGTTNEGAITGLDVSGNAGSDPGNYSSCCSVGPGGDYFNYDNAFLPSDSNPFSSAGGLLFDVAPGIGVTGYSISPINLFGDGNGNTYEFSYGEDVFTDSAPSYGGTEIEFTATDSGGFGGLRITAAPEPSYIGIVILCMGGLVFYRRRSSLIMALTSTCARSR
jgi:hypothetical protein